MAYIRISRPFFPSTNALTQVGYYFFVVQKTFMSYRFCETKVFTPVKMFARRVIYSLLGSWTEPLFTVDKQTFACF